METGLNLLRILGWIDFVIILLYCDCFIQTNKANLLALFSGLNQSL